MIKFAHLSDTHIKNLKYHYEYKIVFEQLYQKLRNEKVNYIIHCGDIAHTKTQISPEFVEMCSDFFFNLAQIAPTYIVLGNHDGNLKNSSRQDALTPIVNALDLDNLHLLKNSGEINIDNKFCLNVLSVFDRDNWIEPTDKDKINIALYHGSIDHCETDIGWAIKNGDDRIGIFKNFDFAFLGDIHKRQFLDHEGRILYCGSTIQQNHGETNDKGFTVWEIEDRDTFGTKHIQLLNPKPFITIELTKKGRIPKKTNVSTGARLRLVSNNNLPLNIMKRAVDVAKHRFKPESISFLNRAAYERGNIGNFTTKLAVQNLREPQIQEELIAEYLKDYEVSAELLQQIYNLNTRYNKVVENTEDISRNINWKLKKFRWNNLFNYGKDNSIDFENVSGITGIFGKNFSGKSSIVDSVLFTMFNTTSKNERKNLNVINQNKDCGNGHLEIEIGDKTYTIERESTKYIKKLKGEETVEAKTDLNFEVHDAITGDTTSLNGNTRNQTDANIRKHFGTIDDFLISSMSSQNGALTFIDEGSTRRKEIIAKFLDLEIFEKKFKLAKEDSIEAKALLKKLEGREYQKEIFDAEESLAEHRNSILIAENTFNSLESRLKQTRADILATSEKISAISTEAIDVVAVRKGLKISQNQIISISSLTTEKIKLLHNEERILQEINLLISRLDYDALSDSKEEIIEIEDELIVLKAKLNLILEKEKLLNSIPCGNSFPSCRFICDANDAVITIPELNSSIDSLQERLSILNPTLVNRNLQKYQKLERGRSETENLIRDHQLFIERNNVALERLNTKVQELSAKEADYELNKEAIEGLEQLFKEKTEIEETLESLEEQAKESQQELVDLYKLVGSAEQKLKNIKQQKLEYESLQQEFAAYDLFMRCTHPNGIAYDIIKRKLPIINEHIAKILSNIVEFEVFFESNGNKFDIFIKHPKHEARPIEMASGAEKTMTAMAIRLSLLSVSSLPKGDLFILDEPGTALDEDNMEGFIRILELIKVYFKNVLLISHLDSLKDCVDMQIVIEKKRGYARVNQ